MPIQLDKILNDIAREKVLHPNYPGATKKELDDAWLRVGKNNSLSVHESRSIFKVLQKKYEQEKGKENSAWKLFAIMDKIHQKIEIKTELKEEDNIPLEEDEEYEMLEVQEEEEPSAPPTNSNESGSEIENAMKLNSSLTSPEKEDKSLMKSLNRNANASAQSEQIQSTKLLNSMASNVPRTSLASSKISASTAAALQKKGVTMKKTQIPPGNQGQTINNRSLTHISSKSASGNRLLEVGKTIQLPESLKRKLSEDQPSTPLNKKLMQLHQQQISQTSSDHTPLPTKSASQSILNNPNHLIQIKQEKPESITTAASASAHQDNITTASGINVITIPAAPSSNNLVNGIITTTGGGSSSSTAAPVASTSINGFSPRLEEIDFRNDIIFDTANTNGKITNNSEIINLGNFENSLPPTFFKNLCNSSRHEALGLYVANVMNRLRPRSAAKLELGILRAILDIQSEEFEQ
uniref:MADF domain-containing protein n=1 Tax=Glossina brevipalpis TaxID=37001 RepID=A0A1A9WSG3_9MUSC